MSIINGYLLPHAPVFIDEVGGGRNKEVQNTINAYKKVAKEIEQMHPDLLVFISPHGPIFSDAIAIYDLDDYSGNLHQFGEYTLNYKIQKDKAFIEALMKKSEEAKGYFYPLKNKQFQEFQHAPMLDHGVTVPLHFILEQIKDINAVAMSYGSLSYLALMRNGEILKQVADESGKKVIIIASGDMSHALTSEGPYKYHEEGPKFDKAIQSCIEIQAPYQIFSESFEMIHNAAECGLRSYAIMMGAFNKTNLKSKVYSYEGPFGVGYLVAGFTPLGMNEDDQISKLEQEGLELIRRQREQAHLFAKIARQTIETYVKERRAPLWVFNENEVVINSMHFPLSGEEKLLNEPHGTFVSIKKHGTLRGCIGTIVSTRRNTLEEIIQNAISACSKDYRFDPIIEDELNELSISVDVLSELKIVTDLDDLAPAIYGVIVYSGEKRGVLLPNLEGVNTVEEQLRIASNKGGFDVDEIDKIECFTVERFK